MYLLSIDGQLWRGISFSYNTHMHTHTHLVVFFWHIFRSYSLLGGLQVINVCELLLQYILRAGCPFC